MNPICAIANAQRYHSCKNSTMNISIHYGRNAYSHTLEKRSSAPPNPPAGLVELVVVVAVPAETGAALVQPPKSSSAATVGVGLGAPQPLPMSLGVNVSGTFIIDAVDDGAGAGSGTGSGVLQALPPQGSILADIILAAAVVATGSAGFGGAGA